MEKDAVIGNNRDIHQAIRGKVPQNPAVGETIKESEDSVHAKIYSISDTLLIYKKGGESTV